ncbi:hypothetical protein J6590_067642 [Homalodisca vitripennis]|nr:hypothetical protein J6590_067642 [Homalodisca vitripennis]
MLTAARRRVAQRPSSSHESSHMINDKRNLAEESSVLVGDKDLRISRGIGITGFILLLMDGRHLGRSCRKIVSCTDKNIRPTGEPHRHRGFVFHSSYRPGSQREGRRLGPRLDREAAQTLTRKRSKDSS